jgi:N-acyl-D-aspartate/D-glutamate deacylase
VVTFNNTEAADDAAITHPLVMIASDGDKGHPRNAGTYSKVITRYVREQRSLSLMDAIRKMTLMPARRLESSTAAARGLGRLQPGATADIVVFHPDRFADRSTYAAPMEKAVGVEYLLVGGVVVIDRAALVDGVLPGRAIVADKPR